jgi:ATP-dependent protease ClpP protease subunit
MSTNKEDQEVQTVIDRQDLEMGRVFLWGDITEESIHIIIRQMRYIFFANKNKMIYIYIHSCGGSWTGAFAMIDEMRGLTALGATIHTIGLGKAYSCGAMILSAGTERYATTNSSMMLHPSAFDTGYDYTPQHINMVDFYAKEYEQGMGVIAKNCGYTTKTELKWFLNEIKEGLWLFPKEAIQFGLIDNLWDYRWERDITGLE